MKRLLITLLGACLSQLGMGQINNTLVDSQKLAWFKNAKFGIFMHWGVYSVGRTSESWPFFSGTVGYEDKQENYP